MNRSRIKKKKKNQQKTKPPKETKLGQDERRTLLQYRKKIIFIPKHFRHQ